MFEVCGPCTRLIKRHASAQLLALVDSGLQSRSMSSRVTFRPPLWRALESWTAGFIEAF
jgi:hypothetical protein